MTIEDFFCFIGILGFIAGIFGMFAVIWTVQLIIYPSFLDVDPTKWQDFHRRHCQRMGIIVGPLMICELVGVTTFCLVIGGIPTGIYAMLACTIFSWFITGGIFVPLHRQLGKQLDPQAIHKLIKLNWIRTALWTCQPLIFVTIVLYMLNLQDT